MDILSAFYLVLVDWTPFIIAMVLGWQSVYWTRRRA
jgi:hypothetical protein